MVWHLGRRAMKKATFNENLAISMGHEIVKPQGEPRDAGKTVARRYTNIWMKGDTGWSLVTRQATIVKVE
jgi:hypothetical protein